MRNRFQGSGFRFQISGAGCQGSEAGYGLFLSGWKFYARLLGMIAAAVFFILTASADASDVTISYYYRPNREELPDRLYVGWAADAGDYSIKLLQQPVLTKSNNYMVADKETLYLVLRVAITNKTDEYRGWLAPGSFRIQDTYMGRYYGTYAINLAESAKVAGGFHQQPFYTDIAPNDTLYTSLVFSVYPDVDNWVMTFAPHHFGSEPAETVRFRLPSPMIEDPATSEFLHHWDWQQNLK